jgi:plasmid replication initiation protein
MKTVASKNKGIKLIRKSNNLIEARYKFDIWETRVFTKVLSLIKPEDADFKTFRLYLKDVIEEFKLKRDNGSYKLLRDATDSLMRKVLYVPYEVDGATRERKYPIVIMSDTLKEVTNELVRQQNSYVELCIHPEMKPLLLELREKFTSYDMRNITGFRSVYAVRIYEHLKQYERIGHRTMDIEYLRRIFEITTEYPLYANFYQKIIQPAEEDINLYSDITITAIDKIKRGRRVESLAFSFYPKTSADRQTSQAAKEWKKTKALPAAKSVADLFENAQIVEHEEDALFRKFKKKVIEEFGVKPTVFQTELKGRGEADVQKAIRITEGVLKKGEVKNVAGFFIEALRKSFTNEVEKRIEKQVENQAKTREKQQRSAELTQEIENLKDAQADDLHKRVRELTATNPELSEDAVRFLRTNATDKAYIESLETDFGRDLTMQDFRDIKRLRNRMLETIFALNQAEFGDITTSYGLKIKGLEKEIRLLN